VPELPEVETIARDLHDAVAGSTISGVSVFRKDCLRACTARSLAARTANTRIDRAWRRAKHVVMDLSNGERITVSPRFTGSLMIEPKVWKEGRRDYTVLHFRLADGRSLRYRDVRRLGTVTLHAPEEFVTWEARIGPEPLEKAFTAGRFREAISGTVRAIKTVLMDQTRIAGIGNIYANEALWRSKIRPHRPASKITRAEARRLHKESVAVLRAAVEQRGTSFRDYQDPYGGRGGFLGLAKVYSREGEPCLRCGTVLKHTHQFEGRISVWCPKCQK
jgi:formamidopyrimidine-DNA glycosylase